MEKGKRLKIRIVSIFLVVVVLVSSVVPVFAESAIEDVTNNYVPWVHGAVCATPYGSDIPTRYFHYIDYYVRYLNNTHYNVSTDLSDLEYFSVYTSPGLTMNIGGGRPRIKQVVSADSLAIDNWQIKLDDFSFQWNSSLFQYFMVLEGIGQFKVNFEVVYFNSENQLLHQSFESAQYSIGETGFRDGVQYWTPKAKQLISSDLANMVIQYTGVTDGQWVLIKNMYIQYWNEQSYADGNHTLTYHIYANDSGVNWQWQTFYANPNNFWEHYGNLVPNSGGVVQPPVEPPTGGDIDTSGWFTALISPVVVLFDTPLFGEISLGDIFGIIVGLCVVFWVLKFFAGG